jgi:hypothetical protein
MSNPIPMRLFQFLAALCLLSVIPAKAAQSGDFTYTATATEVSITAYTGAGGAVVIPASINGTPVMAIGDRAFSSLSGLTSVTIPNSVTSIGSSAFQNCSRDSAEMLATLPRVVVRWHASMRPRL